MVEEEGAIEYYDYWSSVILYFFREAPETLDDDIWLDRVQRFRMLEKKNFLPVKLKE